MGGLLHVGVDVVVRVGNASVAGRRTAPLTGVEQEAKVGPVGFLMMRMTSSPVEGWFCKPMAMPIARP